MNMRRITADRDIVPISYGASPFHQLRRVKECLKNAFVQLALQENGYPIQSKPLTTQIFHTVIRQDKRPNRGQRKSYEKL